MALPSSGTITMDMIRKELKKTGAISLGSSECRKLAGVSSGAIKMSDFYGKSSKIKHEIDWICGEIDYRTQTTPGNSISIGSVYGYGKGFDSHLNQSYNKLKRKATIYSKTSDFEISFLKISGTYVSTHFSFTENNFKEGDRVKVTTKSSTKSVSSEYTILASNTAKQVEITSGSALDLSQFGANRITITFEQI